jgi:hypothetical protein
VVFYHRVIRLFCHRFRHQKIPAAFYLLGIGQWNLLSLESYGQSPRLLIMKTAINLHSFVDLITNSSSELFVCDTDKSVDTVKTILKKLVELYNARADLRDGDIGGHINPTTLFTDIFKEPTAATFTFKLQEYPNYALWNQMFNDRWNSNNLHPILRKAEKDFKSWQDSEKRPDYPSNEKDKVAKRAYEDYMKLYHEKQKEIYTDWNKLVLAQYQELLAWIGKQNNIDVKKFGKLSVGGGSYPKVYLPEKVKGKKNTKGQKFLEEIEDAVSWGYSFKKGDVLLMSASDITIPYNFWADIESTFSVQRLHLG